jgi:RNA polymerase sigma-70 factor
MCTAPSGFPAESPNSREWQRLIGVAFTNAYTCHGDLGLNRNDFSSHIQAIVEKCLPPGANWDQKMRFAGQLHMDDLYLAAACSRHSEEGWRQFERLYQKYLNGLLWYLCSSRHVAAELVDNLLIDLFLPDRTGRSRISSYDGRSTIATWLRTIVVHRLINESQRKCNARQHAELVADLVDRSACHKVESAVKIKRYEVLLEDALRLASTRLLPKEKLLLLWRFDEGYQLGEIARCLGVHQSTVTRGLERVVRKLREEVISALAARHRLDDAAIEECLTVLLENQARSTSVLAFIRETMKNDRMAK